MIRLLLIEGCSDDAVLISNEIRKFSNSIEIVRVTDQIGLDASAPFEGFDIILADHDSSNVDVPELVGRLASEHPTVPIILLSDSVDVDTAVRYMKLGARDFLLKTHLTKVASSVRRELAERDLKHRISAFDTAIRHSELKFSATFLQSAVGFAQITPGLVVAQVNHSYAEMIGKDPAEMIGRDWSEIFPDDVEIPAAIRHMLDQRLDGWEGERFLAGVDVPVSSSISPIRNDDGEILFFSEVLTRLSRGPETGTTNRTALFREAVLQSTLEGICAIDAHGRCTLLNSAAQRALGHEDWQGVDFHSLIHPDCTEGEGCLLLRTALTGQVVRYRLTDLATADGRRLPVIFSSLPVLGEKADRGSVFVFNDVSEQKRLQRQIEQFGRLESLGRLSGKIAHDFNNVLMGILPFAELMLSESPSSDPTEAARFIRAAVERGQRITQQLIQYAQPQEPQRTPTKACELIKSVVDRLTPTIPAGTILRFRCDHPSARISVDHTQIKQVLRSMILNATEAMPQGGSIEVILTTAEAEGSLPGYGSFARDWVMITIKDDGTGMAPETLKRAFEPMFTTKTHGTGLGLAVARQIIESHGGEIFAESRAGEGSSFHLILKPLRQSVPTWALDPAERI